MQQLLWQGGKVWSTEAIFYPVLSLSPPNPTAQQWGPAYRQLVKATAASVDTTSSSGETQRRQVVQDWVSTNLQTLQCTVLFVWAAEQIASKSESVKLILGLAVQDASSTILTLRTNSAAAKRCAIGPSSLAKEGNIKTLLPVSVRASQESDLSQIFSSHF